MSTSLKLPSGTTAQVSLVERKPVLISSSPLPGVDSGFAVGDVTSIVSWLYENAAQFKRVIVSSEQSACYHMHLARKYSCSIALGTDQLDVSALSRLEYSKERLAAAYTEHEFSGCAQQLVKAVVSEYPKSLDRDSAVSTFNDAAGGKFPAVAYRCCSQLCDELDRKDDYAHSLVSTSNRTVVAGPSDQVILDSVASGGITAVGTSMGSGKTSGLIMPLLDQIESDDRRAIYISPKRSIVDTLATDTWHYKKIQAGTEHGVSVLMTVVNSLALSRWSHMRSNIDLLVIDELSEVLSQVAGDAVHGGLAGREKVLDALRHAISSAKSVLIADAGMSDQDLEFVESCRGGEKAHVFSSDTLPQRKIRYGSGTDHAWALASARLDVEAGKRVAVLTDVSSNALDSYISMVGGDSARIDASTDKSLITDEYIESNQVTWMTPVVSSGVSLTTKSVDRVYILACGAVVPRQLLQMTARFRCVDDVVVAFKDRRSTAAELCKMTTGYRLIAEDAWNKKYQEQLFSMTGVIGFAVDQRHAAAKQRADYINTTLLLLSETRHDVCLHESAVCEEFIAAARSEMRVAKSAAKALRWEYIKGTAELTASEAEELVAKEDRVTREEGLKLQAHSIRTAYKVSQITDKDLAFDRDGIGRYEVSLLRNLRSDRAKSAVEEARSVIMSAVFSSLGIDAQTGSWAGDYTPGEASEMLLALHSTVVKYAGAELTMDAVARTVFDGIEFNQGMLSTKAAKLILKHFGLKVERKGKTRRGGTDEALYGVCAEHAAILEDYAGRK